jgi:hypothetical protein
MIKRDVVTHDGILERGSSWTPSEQLVSEILWMEGYWVRTSVKVELTKEEKRRIGLPSAPRWELDIVAYNARDNILRVVECKSYFDSVGVRASAFDGSNADHATRYKLFNKPDLRQVVFNRLCLQMVGVGACREGAVVKLSLAAGKVRFSAARYSFCKSNSWFTSPVAYARRRAQFFSLFMQTVHHCRSRSRASILAIRAPATATGARCRLARGTGGETRYLYVSLKTPLQ